MKEVPAIIEEYQCSGCMRLSSDGCYQEKNSLNISCANHYPGTLTFNGTILLGFPNGFNRIGPFEKFEINVYKSYHDMEKEWSFNKFNVPVWKHLTENNEVIVRGFCPRSNKPFMHLINENCIDEINCLNITQSDIDGMD